MIDSKFLKMFLIPSVDEYVVDGKSDALAYYEMYLSSTDQRVLQHIREKALGLPQRLSDDEYIELEQSRQFAVEQIRILSSENE